MSATETHPDAERRPGAPETTIVEFENVWKRYGAQEILAGVQPEDPPRRDPLHPRARPEPARA